MPKAHKPKDRSGWIAGVRTVYRLPEPGEQITYHAPDGRTFIVPPNYIPPGWPQPLGDIVPIILDIEARERVRLKDGGNPLWFRKLHDDFRERRDPAANVSFAEYCARRHPEKIDQASPWILRKVKLSDREEVILGVLLRNHAFSKAKGMTLGDIIKAEFGVKRDPAGFKGVAAQLKHKWLTDSMPGRNGRCWLTPEGRAMAEGLEKR